MNKERDKKKKDSRPQRLVKYLGQTRPGTWLSGQWNRHPARLVGFLLLGVAAIFFVSNFLEGKFFRDFSANFATELTSIAITVLIIDYLYQRTEERKEDKRLRDRLIREMGSGDNGIALRAVAELRAHGWLEDGSLSGINLPGYANLWGADLHFANLENAFLAQANLGEANLYGANLKYSNLMSAA